MSDESKPSAISQITVNQRVADMLAANFDEPRFDSVTVFNTGGGKVAAILLGDRREDVESLHAYLQGYGESTPPGERSGEMPEE
ncbi:MAG: hypothetical protein WDZ59_10050 [Pirellulales bacterium]